jgi:hypothetical protein
MSKITEQKNQAVTCKIVSSNQPQPYTLSGFKPGIFFLGGGRDDHYATPPPGQNVSFFSNFH